MILKNGCDVAMGQTHGRIPPNLIPGTCDFKSSTPDWNPGTPNRDTKVHQFNFTVL